MIVERCKTLSESAIFAAHLAPDGRDNVTPLQSESGYYQKQYCDCSVPDGQWPHWPGVTRNHHPRLGPSRPPRRALPPAATRPTNTRQCDQAMEPP